MDFCIQGKDFYKDGAPVKIISGAIHYFRNMPDTWDDIFLKLKALGCNCVETYCAWNMHEKKKGEFDFSGRLDLARFIRKAGEYGLMAIVRPGPYICAEWEFGGLPWWLQTEPEMEIRCSNRTYMYYFSRYLQALFDRLRPLLSTNGGNIIMLQVENEYGYYGDDRAYLNRLVELYREKGMDVPLFTSDGCSRESLLDGRAQDCFSTLNFGSRVEENFKAHDVLYPDEPKMCMEMWNGWFDAWGSEKHMTTSAETYAGVVDDMLKKGSLNMYMFIGGTNFGFTSGANHVEKFAPDVTSYDYDALLTEWGDITPKYMLVREVIHRHTGMEPPEVPGNRPKKAYGRVCAEQSAFLFDNLNRLSAPVYSEVPKCMEDYNTGYGYILYQTTLNRDYDRAKLTFERIGDRAQVYVNETYVGTVYVNDDRLEAVFSARSGDVLRIVCENMGRTNFGPKMMYKKGIVGRCLIDERVHFHWETYPLPMDNLESVHFHDMSDAAEDVFLTAEEGSAVGAQTFYSFHFQIEEEPEDSFLRLDNFRKGFAVLNGFNLGRYWEIGPQRTLYVPAGVFRQGENILIVFESDGLKGVPEVTFVDIPDVG